jgi:hypothetical protein
MNLNFGSIIICNNDFKLIIINFLSTIKMCHGFFQDGK